MSSFPRPTAETEAEMLMMIALVVECLEARSEQLQRAVRLLFEGCDLLAKAARASEGKSSGYAQRVAAHRATVEAFLEDTVNDARVIALARRAKASAPPQ